jgi:hypothetical protein
MPFCIVWPFFLLTFEIGLCSCRTPSRYQIEAFQQWWRSRATDHVGFTSSPTPGTAEAATEGLLEGGLIKLSRATARLSMSDIRAKRGWF